MNYKDQESEFTLANDQPQKQPTDFLDSETDTIQPKSLKK